MTRARTRSSLCLNESDTIVLQPKNINIVEKVVEKSAPLTPGKQVKKLKDELEKKDAENEKLRANIDELTNALTSLNIMKEKIELQENKVETKKKKKDKGDDDAPLPAKTAYKFFCEAMSKTKEGEDMRKIWKEYPPQDREQYVRMAFADKARFEQENAKYQEEKIALEMYYEKKKEDTAIQFYEAHLAAQAALAKAESENTKSKKKKKDPEAPKRPVSAYMFYVMDHREAVQKENPEAKVTDISKILGESWGKLHKGKKGKTGTKKYDDLAAEDKERYLQEKAKYDEMMAKREEDAVLEESNRKQKEKKEALELMEKFQNASDAVTHQAAVSCNDDFSVVSDISTGVDTQTSKVVIVKKKKDPNAPKRALSAYNYFVAEQRAVIHSSMPGAGNVEILQELGRQWKTLGESEKVKYAHLSAKDQERYTLEMQKYQNTS